MCVTFLRDVALCDVLMCGQVLVVWCVSVYIVIGGWEIRL